MKLSETLHITKRGVIKANPNKSCKPRFSWNTGERILDDFFTHIKQTKGKDYLADASIKRREELEIALRGFLKRNRQKYGLRECDVGIYWKNLSGELAF